MPIFDANKFLFSSPLKGDDLLLYHFKKCLNKILQAIDEFILDITNTINKLNSDIFNSKYLIDINSRVHIINKHSIMLNKLVINYNSLSNKPDSSCLIINEFCIEINIIVLHINRIACTLNGMY